jgi:regulation of enolase protein 1 (concanavalin A-like superfamily)
MRISSPLAVAAVLAATALSAPLTAAAAPTGATYTNPVSAPFTDTFADPSIVRGGDGAWYAYATEDAMHPGEPAAKVPMARSTDLAHWSYVGNAFSAAPAYADPNTSYWAPDIRYLDGRYVMYYTVTNTLASTRDGDFAIGAATAPSPTGPWTQSDSPVVPPVTDAAGNYLSVIDPAELTTPDGTRYLYYGSYSLGVHVTRLSADGLHALGTPIEVTVDDRYEGSYVVRHGGWYYLMASSANCCAGPTSGYAVFAGRSRSPLGPFLDRDGVSLDASRVGGTPVVSPQGNLWVGTGHNALVTDDSGQDWLVYHAIDRTNPYLDNPFGVNRRPMMIDRLDWIAGWPTVRAGLGASQGPQPAPAVGSRVTTGSVLRGDVRVRADVVAGMGLGDISVRIDRSEGKLIVASGHHRLGSTSLPAGFSYPTPHQLAVSLRGGALHADVTEGGIEDPVASLDVRVPASPSHRLSFTGTWSDAVAARLYTPVTRAVAAPRAGSPIPSSSDDFSGSAVGPGWTWLREDPAVTVGGGVLSWPTENADLSDGTGRAGVLLRQPPAGDWVAETKVSMDLGVDTVRNFEQAGMVVYAADDDFARLDQVAIGDTRQVEFGREIPYAGSHAWGTSLVGTQAATTWLRIAHNTDPTTGDQVYRAGSSTDGRHWTWVGAWTFPTGTAVRVGLVSQGGNTPPATAQFDYLRFYRLIE